MDKQLLELSLLAAFSAFLSGIAFYQGNLIATAAFAALTCSAGVNAMELRRLLQHACKMGLEGIVSKRKDSRYSSGRSTHWIKTKNPNAPAVKREAEEDCGHGTLERPRPNDRSKALA